MMKVYDISVSLGKEAATYPGDPSFMRNALGSLEEGDLFEVSIVAMSAHCGTHLDAPRHMLIDGKTIDQYSPEELIFPAWVLEIKDKEFIEKEDLKAINVQPGDALLLKTSNSISGLSRKGIFEKEYVYLTEDAARFCAEQGIGLVGIDYISIDRYEGEDYPAHRILLGDNRLILEGISLDKVSPGKYTLICLPIKIKDGEAAPCRAVLIEEVSSINV